MLSNKEIICPNNLLDEAHKKKGVKVAVVNAGKPLPMLSVQDAVNENLIEPIFIGDEKEILKCAEDLKWDISNYQIINEPIENNTAKIAAKLANENKIKIIVKGHIHTDVLMKEVLKREYNLLGKTRLSHIWHMTVEKDDKPLIITDGALNVLPNVKTKMHILKNVINFSNRIGISKPKVAVLSATEEVLESVPSSLDAAELTKLAKEEDLNADVFGPLAFDNSISKKSAGIKGIKNSVATEFFIPFIPADFFEILLSKASGPKTSALRSSSFASFVNSAASKELGTLSKTSSVADKTATFGFEIPILLEKLITFLRICILVFTLGKTFKAPSVIIKGLSSFSTVICQI